MYNKITTAAVALLCTLWLGGCSNVALQPVNSAQTPETAETAQTSETAQTPETSKPAKPTTVAVAPMIDDRAGEVSPLEAMEFLLEMLDSVHMPLDNSAMLDVENVIQMPELPNGCEATSATIVLNYLGFDVDKMTMAEKYLPYKTPYWTVDPNEAFMGNPRSENAFYCLPGPVVQAVNAYLADAGETEMTATDITGASMQDLEWYLTKGVPVLVWATRSFTEPEYGDAFILPDGSAPFTNLHCLVLVGFDEEKFYFADPMQEVTEIDAETFTRCYEEIGECAVAITRG